MPFANDNDFISPLVALLGLVALVVAPLALVATKLKSADRPPVVETVSDPALVPVLMNQRLAPPLAMLAPNSGLIALD
jgi:hypothetical protein